MNLAILISDQKYYRNYLESQVLNLLGASHRLFLVVDPLVTLNLKSDFDRKKIFEINLNSTKRIRILGFIEEVVRTHYRFLSVSFQFRERRFYPPYIEYFKSDRKENSISLPFHFFVHGFIFAKGNFLFLRSRVRKGILYFCASGPMFFVFMKLSRKMDFSISELNAFLKSHSIDLLMIPSGGREPAAVMSTASCDTVGVKSLLMLDNWDNISSKTVFWNKPSFLGTWGPQSTHHAISIQKFTPNQVFDLGTPRFDVYVNKKSELIGMSREFESKSYILFLGSHLFFDEIQILCKLDLILSDPNSELFGLRIVYRPHPHRIRGFDFFNYNFENVTLDPELSTHYSTKEKSSQYVTNLEHYPEIISGAVMVLCGLTSMLIEARILKKPVGVFVHDELGNATSPYNVYRNYLHFEGIENLRDVVLISELSALEKSLLALLHLAGSPSVVDPHLDYFITTKPSSYGIRLKNVVGQIASQL